MTTSAEVIKLTDVSKVYIMGDVSLNALRSVALTICEGEFVSIMGPSGSGKSTTMNILGCLDQPTSGSYRLLGNETAEMVDDELAETRNKLIGFVFQSFNLLSRQSALENEDIAAHTKRIVRFKDGLLTSDERVPMPIRAVQRVQSYPSEGVEAS